MSLDVEAFAAQLKADGNVRVGDEGEHLNGYNIWWESRVDYEFDILGFGVWRVHEVVVGKEGPVTTYDGGNIWKNHIILQQGETFVRLSGEYDSWDAQGWTGEVELVTNQPKVIFEWVKV